MSLLDLFPTLVDLCGMPPMAEHDGVSLRPLLRDPKANWSRPAVIEFRLGNAAARSERYRYIRYRDGGEELYDHRADPHEWKNLAGDPSLAGIKARLAEALPRRWAQPAPTKKAFSFDPNTFRWTDKSTGRVTDGSRR